MSNVFKYLKQNFKNEGFIFKVVLWMLFWYLKFAYRTSRWNITFSENYSKEDFIKEKGVIFAMWHNALAFSFPIFANQYADALVSPHIDGRIIASIVKKFGFGVINGSSNKNSTSALRSVIEKLKNNDNIFITPDGPRGPAFNINSNITEISKKYASKLISINCMPSRAIKLNTWDQMLIPVPFSTIRIKIVDLKEFSDIKDENDEQLRVKLSNL
jgi:lysophospholipid acyltransferase (LPLAT)-like uncharacterized protein